MACEGCGGGLREAVESPKVPLVDKPGVGNWVERYGALQPHATNWIHRAAMHLRGKGFTTGHAIATAKNAAVKLCGSGDVNFPGVQQANLKSRAEACAAVATWEAAQAKAKAARVAEGVEVDDVELEREGLRLAEALVFPRGNPTPNAYGELALVEAKPAKPAKRGRKGKAKAKPEPESTEPDLTLTKGSRKPLVRHLQSRLTAIGHKAKVDGHFGDRTAEAVRNFRSSAGLPEGDHVDDAAVEALRSAKAKESKPSSSAGGDDTLAVHHDLLRTARMATAAAARGLARLRAKGNGGGEPEPVQEARFTANGDALQEASISGLVRRAGGSWQWRNRVGRWIDMPEASGMSKVSAEHFARQRAAREEAAHVGPDLAAASSAEVETALKALKPGRVQTINGRRVRATMIGFHDEETGKPLGQRGTLADAVGVLRSRPGLSAPETPAETAARRNRAAALARDLAPVIDAFEHKGPGGDKAMPAEVRDALNAIPKGASATIAGVIVKRQGDGKWDVSGDPNLASPWVAMQSIKSRREGVLSPVERLRREGENPRLPGTPHPDLVAERAKAGRASANLPSPSQRRKNEAAARSRAETEFDLASLASRSTADLEQLLKAPGAAAAVKAEIRKILAQRRTREAKLDEAARLLAEAGPGVFKPKGRSGKPVGDQEFEREHPRRPKGRTGGGEWERKGASGAGGGGGQGANLIQAGSKGAIAQAIGKQLGGLTSQKISQYQRQHQLTVDGLIGHQTTAALLGKQNASNVQTGALTSQDRTGLHRKYVSGKGGKKLSEAMDMGRIMKTVGGLKKKGLSLAQINSHIDDMDVEPAAKQAMKAQARRMMRVAGR